MALLKETGHQSGGMVVMIMDNLDGFLAIL